MRNEWCPADIEAIATVLASDSCDIQCEDDFQKLIDRIASALVNERNRQKFAIDDMLNVLNFLYYLREEHGENYIFGGVRLKDVVKSFFNIIHMDDGEDFLDKLFRNPK